MAASATALVVVAAVAGSRMLLAMGAAVVVTWFAGRFFERRIGGITGDALGAANQLVELAVYLSLAARPR